MENNILSAKNSADITLKDSHIICIGPWTQQGIAGLQKKWLDPHLPTAEHLELNGKDITKLDSAGAWLLIKLLRKLEAQHTQVTLKNFHEEQLALITLLQKQETLEKFVPVPQPALLAAIGMKTVHGCSELTKFLSFIGEIFIHALGWMRYPSKIRWVSLLSGIQFTGYNAILIVGLLAILIGIVLAYQLGVQLKNYGADIYVVDLLGISLLREFAPLLTAIIIAGRTGSSYTAQIGTMKLNEEIDALSTFGLSPIELLVLPRMLALMIALPLLTVLADVFSVLGGMIMSHGMLGLGYMDFLSRFAKAVALKNYVIGLIKTPVFAVLIASIGCYQGFQVSGSAQSVGEHTTMSVVQSIFMIIVADAAFSVIFSKLGI